MQSRMTVLGSLRSPYCRKVMILVHELGLATRLDLVAAAVGASLINTTVQSLNPLGKVPVLITEDGVPLYDSLVICLFLERLGEETHCGVSDQASTLHVMQWHALGQGLTDVLLQWNRERARPESKRTEGYAPVLGAKVTSTLDALEDLTVPLHAAQFGLAHAAIASALGYLDFRFADVDWRKGRPLLDGWFALAMARPSCATTIPS